MVYLIVSFTSAIRVALNRQPVYLSVYNGDAYAYLNVSRFFSRCSICFIVTWGENSDKCPKNDYLYQTSSMRGLYTFKFALSPIVSVTSYAESFGIGEESTFIAVSIFVTCEFASFWFSPLVSWMKQTDSNDSNEQLEIESTQNGNAVTFIHTCQSVWSMKYIYISGNWVQCKFVSHSSSPPACHTSRTVAFNRF